MGETIIEKIIRHNTGKAVKPGDIVTVNVDRCMIHDIFIPFVADKFEEMGFTKLHDPDKVVLIYDHLVPASQQDDTRHFHKGDEFVEKYGLTHVHRSDGICHQLMTEAGYVKPGDIAFGTDSHTTTYGCVGAFSSGIGYTEMASILGTGTMWIKVPETIKVVIDGELPENVMSKDIILRLIGDLRADGATYRALEFSGSTIEKMSVASRMTMANMAIEAGAKNGIFPVDDKTIQYLNEHTKKEYTVYEADEDAEYEQVVEIDLAEVRPTVAFPHLPGNAKTIDEIEAMEPIKIDQVVIGSCTNGRMEDMRKAAAILKGHKVHEDVRVMVIPATQKIYKQCIHEGLMDIFVDAGCAVNTPSCGPCMGGHMGVMAAGEKCVSTTNRNFVGRMGHVDSLIYLASPEVAAASAIAGCIANPEKVEVVE